MEEKDRLKEFLNKSNIEIINEKTTLNFSNSMDKHIENVIKFHRRVIEYENYFDLGLKNNAGKDIAGCKLWYKRALLLKEELNINNDVFEEILDKSKKALENIEQSNYVDLIVRAGIRKEIVVGNGSNKNIYFYNGKIYIKNIDKIEFNMVESDCIKYILKEKKKKKHINIDRVISLFLEGEGLHEDSFNYIYGMVSYPKESMRYISNSYINNLKDENRLIDNLNSLVKIDYLGLV